MKSQTTRISLSLSLSLTSEHDISPLVVRAGGAADLEPTSILDEDKGRGQLDLVDLGVEDEATSVPEGDPAEAGRLRVE